MASRTPWSGLDLQDDATRQRLGMLGQQALDTGQVSPEDAQKMAQAMGITAASKGAPGVTLPMSGANPATLDMGSMRSPSELYAGVNGATGIKGSKQQASMQDSSTFKRSRSQANQFSDEDTRAMRLIARGRYPKITGYQNAVDANGELLLDKQNQPLFDRDRPIRDFNDVQVDEEDPVHQQEVGLDRLQDLLRAQVDASKGRSTMDFSPLAALSDALNAQKGHPTNLAASFSKPEDTSGKFMAAADEIQKRRADVQKSITEGVKAQKAGTTQDALIQALASKVGASQGDQIGSARGEIADENRAWRTHENVIRRVTTDKQLQNELSTFNVLGSGLSVLEHSDITPNVIDEAQQSIKSAMNLMRNNPGTGSEREKTYLNSVGLSAERFGQFLTGDPAQIAKDNAIVQHLRGMAAIEQQNMQTLFDRRINAISAGSSWMYNDPKYRYRESLNEFLAAQRAQIPQAGATPTKGGKAVTKQVQRAGIPAPKKAAAAPAFDSMSNDELKAFIQSGGH